MSLMYLRIKLAKAQFAILLLGFLLQRSPALQLFSLFEKTLRMPVAQVVKSATWLATGMGLFHATAGATGLQTSVNFSSPSNRTSFTFEVGEQVFLEVQLEGVLGLSYWEIDARSDLVDGFDFVDTQLNSVPLLGPFTRNGEPSGVNEYYRVDGSRLYMFGSPTIPSSIGVEDPAKDKYGIGIKAYDAGGNSEEGWYQLSVEVPLTVPQILRSPVSVRVPTGGRAQFFFEADGVVESVQWLKDGIELAGETSETLVVADVSAAEVGAYSVEVTNSSGSAVSDSGSLIIDDAAKADLVNLANRGFVGTGGNIMIPGMVILGGSSKTVLVRGLGPALENQGVPGFLEDPELKVFQTIFENGVPVGSQLLLTNDDWEIGPNAGELASVLTERNLELTAGSKDAAILVTLNQGVFTFQLSGVGDTTGVGLVELFVIE